MFTQHAQAKRSLSVLQAGIMLLSLFVPLLIMANAGAYEQITERSITISSSEVSRVDNVYTVSFKPATAGTIQTVIIDFCDSPLIGTVCNAPAALDTNHDDSLAVYNESGTNFGTAFTVDGTESTDNRVVIKDATAASSVAAGTAVSFDLGDGTANNGIDNPSATGSFYARILTYADTTAGDTYDSASTGSNNPPAATVDAGGVALSTANQLTINARVQEVLQFCVGTDDADTAGDETDDCTDISGTTVDLGVIQSGTPTISPVAATSGGNNKTGLAMVRTNAVNGVVIDYFAEAVTGDTATGSGYAGSLGALKVSGQECVGTGTIAGGTKTDQCFNSAGATQLVFAAADEGFGMTVSAIDVTNGTTSNVVRDTQYDGNGTNGAGNGWAWSETTTDRIASSTGSAVKVVDDELLTLTYAAQAAVTTPTGQYGVTSTYIATSSF